MKSWKLTILKNNWIFGKKVVWGTEFTAKRIFIKLNWVLWHKKLLICRPQNIYFVTFLWLVFFCNNMFSIIIVSRVTAESSIEKIWNSTFLISTILLTKVIMLGKLFQRCTHLLYCSIVSIFHIKINEIFWSQETFMWIIKMIKM